MAPARRQHEPAWYPGLDNLDKLYVYYFTRNCEGLDNLTHGFCLPAEDTRLAIPAGDRASIVEREYITTGHDAGPTRR